MHAGQSYFFVDFETGSSRDIKEYGMTGMLAAPDAVAHCMAWSTSFLNYHVNLATDADSMRSVILFAMNSGFVLVAHNAPFELEVMRRVLGIDWPITRVICTMARAAYYGYPWGLDAVAERIGSPVLKDLSGKKDMMKLARNKLTYEQAPETFKRMYEYCKTDLLVLLQVHERLPLLPDAILRRWQVDTQINFFGVPVDEVAIRNGVRLKAIFEHRNNTKMHALTDGFADAVTKVGKIHEYLTTRLGLTLPDLTADTVARALAGDLPERARLILQLRQDAGLSSLAKFEKMLNYCVDGRIFHAATWYGAHTGRPTGNGPQLLNLPRSEHADFYAEMLRVNPDYFLDLPDGPARLKEALRGVICAPRRVKEYA